MTSQLTPSQQDALASFQAVTNNNNTVECIAMLQAHDWQLEEAISTMLAAEPTHSSTTTSTSASTSTSTSPPLSYPSTSTTTSLSSTSFLNPSSSSSYTSSSSSYQPPNYHPPPSFSTFSHHNNTSSSFMSARSHGDEKQTLLTSSSVSSAATPVSTQQSQGGGGLLALPFSLISGTLRLAGRVATSILPTIVTAPFISSQGPNLTLEQQFYHDFRRQYPNGPVWVEGSYSDATRLARNSSRMLFVYLHCSTHDDTHAFIQDTLCSEMLCDFLRENFISWVGSIKHSEAYRLCHTLQATAFPFVAVLAPHQQQMAVVLRHSGPISPEDLIAQLVLRMEAHRAIIEQQQQRANIQAMEQAQRNMARNLIQEQDREYQEALEADRQRNLESEREARERAAEVERIAALAREAEAEIARVRAAEEAAIAERERKRLALGDEPAIATGVVSVSIRIPSGKKYERRFYDTDAIARVFDYVETLDLADGGDPIEQYQIISNFPRKVHERSDATIKSLNLGRKVMLFVEPVFEEEENVTDEATT